MNNTVTIQYSILIKVYFNNFVKNSFNQLQSFMTSQTCTYCC